MDVRYIYCTYDVCMYEFMGSFRCEPKHITYQGGGRGEEREEKEQNMGRERGRWEGEGEVGGGDSLTKNLPKLTI